MCARAHYAFACTTSWREIRVLRLVPHDARARPARQHRRTDRSLQIDGNVIVPLRTSFQTVAICCAVEIENSDLRHPVRLTV